MLEVFRQQSGLVRIEEGPVRGGPGKTDFVLLFIQASGQPLFCLQVLLTCHLPDRPMGTPLFEHVTCTPHMLIPISGLDSPPKTYRNLAASCREFLSARHPASPPVPTPRNHGSAGAWEWNLVSCDSPATDLWMSPVLPLMSSLSCRIPSQIPLHIYLLCLPSRLQAAT